MKRLRLASFLSCNRVSLLNTIILLFSLACSSKPPQQSRTSPAVQPATGASSTAQATIPPFAAEAEDGQWTMPAKNYASTRYSGLDQINTENVKT